MIVIKILCCPHTGYYFYSRKILTRLGPCFIKLGQAISIRPDILPSRYKVVYI